MLVKYLLTLWIRGLGISHFQPFSRTVKLLSMRNRTKSARGGPLFIILIPFVRIGRRPFSRPTTTRLPSPQFPIRYNAQVMSPDRIADLLSPFIEGASLSESQLDQIAGYAALLEKWNARMNLTAVRNSEEVITRHFGESLFAARILFPNPEAETTAIDIGSGAGFPGLPLKIWAPALELTLIESNQRKAVFLREVVRTLNLQNVKVLSERAEQVSAHADLVTIRAVERFEQILPVALTLAAPSGRIALLIGDSQIPAAKSALHSVRWEEPASLPLSLNRSLLVGHAIP